MARHNAPSCTAASLRLRPLALSLLCLGLAPALAQTLPTGFNPIAGGVTMNQVPGTMNIVQSTARGIVQWQTFSIGAGGTVNIAQPSFSSVLLNRVVGNDLSTIAGTLNANGHVFLVNPNGVLFSKGAVVNVGGLVASTLDVGNAAFSGDNVNRPLTKGDAFVFERDDGNAASVVNQGSITAANKGIVALVGAAVRNEGSINVAQGSIGLVSGRKLTLDYEGDGLTSFTIAADSKAANALVENAATGTLTADGGRVVMLAASTAAELVVNQSGVVRARSLSSRGGEILLGAEGNGTAEARVAGTLDATGSGTVAGGSVTVNGGLVRLDGAAIDASGSQGGSVAVTGINAVAMSPAASIRADAIAANGAGGMVSVGAGNVTHISGSLSARGTGSGAGGSITTSGGALEVTPVAQVDASGGATGANGKWTLNSTLDLNVSTEVPAYDPANYVTPTTNTQVHVDAIGGALGRATDVTLNSAAVAVEGRSDGTGVVFANDAQVLKTQGREATLTVNSVHNIQMATGSGIVSTAGPLNVAFNADSAGTPLPATLPVGETDDASRRGAIDMRSASIESNGGNIAFYGQSDPVGGRAVGGYDGNFNGFDDGIRLTASRLSTCTVAAGGCGGAGSISLRGQGATTDFGEGGVGSGIGVNLRDSELVTGAGAITVDGRGGLGSAGVVSGLQPFTEGFAALVAVGAKGDGPLIQSGGGDITLVGSSRGWVAGDPVVDFSGTPSATSNGRGAGAGVAIDSTTISTGGSIRIDGKGGDISGLAAQPGYLDQVAPFFVGGTNDVGAGNATLISYSSLTAGPGRSITVSGTPGSAGFSVTRTGAEAIAVTPDEVGPYGVSILATPGNGLQAAGGQITIDGGNGNVSVQRLGADEVLPADGPTRVLSTASTTGPGGRISITGRNVLIDGGDDGEGGVWQARIDSSGVGQAGSIDIRAIAAPGVAQSGVVALGSNSSLEANATSASGNGGTIRAVGDTSLRAYGDLSAHAGSAGGNGGLVETSAPTLALAGVRVDASAPAGTPGTWLVDPSDVNIVAGVAAGTLTANPFVPVAASTIQSGDINAALDKGTSVTIGTGAVGGGTGIEAGNISFGPNVAITYAKNNGPVTFELDANRSIFGAFGTVISSTGDPLSVVMNANANGLGATNGGGGYVSYGGSIFTNGGSVTMNGSLVSPQQYGCAVCLNNAVIDTRAGGTDAGVGGAVQLTGTVTGTPYAFGFPGAAVQIGSSQIRTSTGKVTVFGSSSVAGGVELAGNANGGPNGIATTSGDVLITGIGSPYAGVYYTAPGDGVLVSGASVQTTSGDITVRGLHQAGALGGTGAYVTGGGLLRTTGGGDIEVTGQSAGGGAGVVIDSAPQQNNNSGAAAFAPGILAAPALPVAPTPVQSSANVVLRASNDNASDALVIGAPVYAANVLNLRPGGVTAAGAAFDQTAVPIVLGGAGGNGFSVSGAEFANLVATAVVAGSNTHAADITVAGPLATAAALTLQNGGGGNIALNAPVTAPALGLLSAGNIGQAVGAPITAGTLLARSTGGNVLLTNGLNNVDVVGGGAAGQFFYNNADGVTLGGATATGFDAAANLPQALTAASTDAGTLRVRALTGDLTLGGNVSSTNGADLVAAGRLQNPGGYRILGAPWRVWADTWLGEQRGGLAGSGLLPNLYHCAFLGLCTVTVTPGDNHFIYAQQPSATVVVGNATRQGGQANPVFTYSVTGLILGDTGAGIAGTLSSAANLTSVPGTYAINGSFTSAEGYALTVVPGSLTVTGFPSLPKVDVVRDATLLQTYVYDRNVGQPPICFAPGALEGDRAEQTGDVLAREWSRVRSRPNLLSCVSTEKRNGCADF